jgi:multicomponent Na+:H+ antiporter subunit A
MLLSLVLITLVAAPVALLARAAPRPPFAWLLALVPFGAFVAFATAAPAVLDGREVVNVLPWVPAMGLELRLVLDGLSLFFALLVSGIGTLIVLYTGAYMAGDASMGRFLMALFVFMGAMLGLVLSDNILTLFLFWELTSVSSYLLVGHKHEYAEARRGAQMGLLITFGGGLGLLVGLVILGAIAGTSTISAINASGDLVRASPFYGAALALICLGCFTKSAQFPVHFWLPNAMQAPTPASAFLHSATMVKAGVFLLARLAPAMGGTELWAIVLSGVGATTMLVGAVVALRKDDIKGLLAYSTVSMLGTLVLLVGMGGPEAPAALIAMTLGHALYKGALFMLAGAVDHEAGTRKLSQLGGLRATMPRTFWLTVLAALSLAGLPPVFGFVAKEELLYAATSSALRPGLGLAVLLAVVVSAVLSVIAAWRLISGVFLGPRGAGIKQHAHEAPLAMLVGPGVLTLLSVALPFGLLDPLERLLLPAVQAVGGAEASIGLYLIPSLGLPLLLSVIAIALGVALARFAPAIARMRSPLPPWLSGDAAYDGAVSGMLAGATRFTRAIQNGRMRSYLLWSMLALVAAVLPALLLWGLNGVALPSLAGVQPYELVTALLIPVGVLATITARSRLGAIISAGIVGAMVAFLFVIYSAPDLALTQLLIEVIATVFFMLVFALLPPAFERLSGPRTRMRDGLVAAVVGITMGSVTYAAASSQAFPSISGAFRAESLAEAFGANVVNVIIVDFRGFDTLGEITVLFIALLGIFAMLRLRPEADPTLADPATGEDAPKPMFRQPPEPVEEELTQVGQSASTAPGQSVAEGKLSA